MYWFIILSSLGKPKGVLNTPHFFLILSTTFSNESSFSSPNFFLNRLRLVRTLSLAIPITREISFVSLPRAMSMQSSSSVLVRAGQRR